MTSRSFKSSFVYIFFCNLLPLFCLTALQGQTFRLQPLTHPDGLFILTDLNSKGDMSAILFKNNGDINALLRKANGEIITLPGVGGTNIQAIAINDSGHVAGFSSDAGGFGHAGVWDANGFNELSLPAGTTAFAVNGINNFRQVSGAYLDGSSVSHALRWESDGTFQILPDLPGGSGFAIALNNNGDVVGCSADANSDNHAVRWQQLPDQSFEIKDLGTLGGLTSEANDINDAGQIVGAADLPTAFAHAFLWENDLMTDLGTLGGDFSRAFSINESGVIVGPSQVSGGVNASSAASNMERMSFFPIEALAEGRRPHELFDEFGIAAGSKDPTDRGWIWRGNGMEDIHDFVPKGSSLINEVFVVNDSDLIGTFNVTEIENCAGVPYALRGFGTEINRDKIDIIDNVNTSTGEFAFDEPGGIQGIDWGYTYATLPEGLNPGPCATGTNWQHNYELDLTRFGDDYIEVLMHKGRVLLFEKAANGTLSTASQSSSARADWTLLQKLAVPFQLVENGSDFILGDPRNNLMYTFNDSGEVTKIENGKGYVQTLAHTNGKLTEVTDSFGQSLTFEYDQDHVMRVSDGTREVNLTHTGDLLTSVSDAEDNVTTYTYDANHPMPGLMTSKTLPEGNSPFTITYDEDGRVVSRTDANGNATTFEYISNGNGSGSSLLKLAGTTAEAVITDPLGNIRRCFYNENGQVVTLMDPAGKSISIGYDNLGRRKSITDRTGATTSWDFHDPSGRVSAIHNPDGGTINFAYASRSIAGLTFYDLSSMTFPDGTSETLVHDGFGNLTSATEQAGNTNILTYNNFGQVLTITNPEGGVNTTTYNNDGTPATMTDPAGNTTTLSFDALRRLEQITFADGAIRTVTYNDNNQALTVTDGRGNTTAFTYDNNGNRVSKMDALGNTTTFAFDQMERLIRATDPSGNSVLFDYNEVGKVKTWTDRLGSSIAFNYDAGGRLTSITDGDGNTSLATYTDESILASISDPLGNTINFASDNMARLSTITTPLGSMTRFGRDVMGRANSIENRLGLSMVTLDYNPNGLLTGVNALTGAMTSYTRNALGNVTQARDFIGNSWSFGRNNQGLLDSATDPLGNSKQYTYNSLNKTSNVVFPGGLGSVDVSYDGSGNPTNLQYSDGAQLTFDYDALNRPASASGVSFDYNANSRITESNGLTMTRDARGRITSVTLAPGKTVTYEYNNRHLITKITDWLNGMTTFTYDAAGRLTQMTRPNGTVATYDYDAENQVNEITDTVPSNNGSAAKNGVDKAEHSAQADTLVAIKLFRNNSGQVERAERNVPETGSLTLTSGTTTLTYDAASQISDFDYNAMGQLTSDDRRSYTWNLATRLTGYTENDTTIDFTYDALGGRLTRSDGSTTQAYVWNYAFNRPSVSVVRQDGSDVRYYIHTPNGNLLHSIEAGDDSQRFYHFDETGNTLALSNEQAAIVASYAYSPYGQILGENGSDENPFTYLGRYGVTREGSSGLYYMRERYFDSRNGRFISREATDPIGFNPYQYGFGNPLRFINPVGVSISALFLFLPFLGGWFRRHTKEIILCSLLSLLTLSGCGGGCTDAEVEAFWRGVNTGDFSRFDRLFFGEAPFLRYADGLDGVLPRETILGQGSGSKNRGTAENNYFFFTSALPRSVDPSPVAADDDFFLGPGLELKNGGFLKAIYTDRTYNDFVEDFTTVSRGTRSRNESPRTGILNEQQAFLSNLPLEMAVAISFAESADRTHSDPPASLLLFLGDQSNSLGGDSPLDALGLPTTFTPGPNQGHFDTDDDFADPRSYRFTVGFRF